MLISKLLATVCTVFITSWCISLAHSVADISHPVTGAHFAGLVEKDPDTGSTSAACGADGKCNAGVCRNDPDCPNLGTTTPVDQQPAQSDTEVTDCAPGETLEMREAIAWGAANWNAFEAAIESFYGWPVNIKNCLENRFKDNGKIVCEQDMGGMCTDRQGPNNAWASALNKRCHLCPNFLNRVKAFTGSANKDNRKACYFALLAHEWAHTCDRSHKTVEIIDNVAFDFWKANHPSTVTISFGSGGCGMN
jgi:hypothetical protein